MESIKENYIKIEKLHHPNIAAVKAMEYDENQNVGYFIVMEYVKGKDLKYWLKKELKSQEKLELETVTKILKPVAEALDYAHHKKIIHRDIKPENIMVTEDLSEVKILDFGLAAQIRSSLSMVSMKSMDISGTRPYMSPEQWQGKRQDARTDQYSLAVLAYEMLSSELSFNADYLITSNIRDYTKNTNLKFDSFKIITPAEFVKSWRKEK
jgi:eukaryotic-like serine/threonine-protein kinase